MNRNNSSSVWSMVHDLESAPQHFTQNIHQLPLMRYQHQSQERCAEIDYHETEQLWSVSLIHDQGRRIHGLYPSLASAQLILCALGFKRIEERAA